MRKLKLSDATAPLSEYAQDLKQGPLIVTVRGKPVAALVPIEGVDMESLCVGTSPEFLNIIERSRRRTEKEGTLSSDEVRRHFGIPTVPLNFRPKKTNGKKSNGELPKPARSVGT